MRINHIKIPYKCLLPLVGNSQLRKAFIIYGKLKMKHSNSVIHDIKSRKQELAKELSISENTLRKYIGILKVKGLVWEEDNRLRLANRYKLYEVFNIERNFNENKNRYADKSYTIKKEDFNEDKLILLALQYKKDTINYNNTKRISQKLIKEYGTINCPKIKRKISIRCQCKAKSIVESQKQKFAENFTVSDEFGFVDDNLSTSSIGKLIGRKSKMSGCRLMNKLKDSNLISLNKREILLGDINLLPRIYELQDSLPFKIVLRKKQKLNKSNYICAVGTISNSWAII